MARCAACGEALAPRARFCSMCGRRVAADPPPTEPLLPPSRPLPESAPKPGGAGLTSLALLGAIALAVLAVLARGRSDGLTAFGSAAAPAPTAAALLAPLASPTPQLVDYQELHLDVPAGGSYRLTFAAWPAGAVFQGYFVAAAALDFRVEQPGGDALASLQHVSGRYDFRYIVPEAGQYAVIFADSATPPTAQALTLVYRTDVPGT